MADRESTKTAEITLRGLRRQGGVGYGKGSSADAVCVLDDLEDTVSQVLGMAPRGAAAVAMANEKRAEEKTKKNVDETGHPLEEDTEEALYDFGANAAGDPNNLMGGAAVASPTSHHKKKIVKAASPAASVPAAAPRSNSDESLSSLSDPASAIALPQMKHAVALSQSFLNKGLECPPATFCDHFKKFIKLDPPNSKFDWCVSFIIHQLSPLFAHAGPGPGHVDGEGGFDMEQVRAACHSNDCTLFTYIPKIFPLAQEYEKGVRLQTVLEKGIIQSIVTAYCEVPINPG
jgi:hypothetical protein